MRYDVGSSPRHGIRFEPKLSRRARRRQRLLLASGRFPRHFDLARHCVTAAETRAREAVGAQATWSARVDARGGEARIRGAIAIPTVSRGLRADARRRTPRSARICRRSSPTATATSSAATTSSGASRSTLVARTIEKAIAGTVAAPPDNKGQHSIVTRRAAERAGRAWRPLGSASRCWSKRGEEVGSPGSHAACAELRDVLAADNVLIASGRSAALPRTANHLSRLARLGQTSRLTLRLREGGHHSGNWGGLLRNPRRSRAARSRAS